VSQFSASLRLATPSARRICKVRIAFIPSTYRSRELYKSGGPLAIIYETHSTHFNNLILERFLFTKSCSFWTEENHRSNGKKSE